MAEDYRNRAPPYAPLWTVSQGKIKTEKMISCVNVVAAATPSRVVTDSSDVQNTPKKYFENTK